MMKKTVLKIMVSLLAVVAVFAVGSVCDTENADLFNAFSIEANALTSGDYTYTVSGSNATITAYSGTATDLVIPSKLSGYKVTSIGDGAFKANNTFVSVTIPEGVTFIGDAAFYECKKLESVSLPSTLTRIDGFYVNNGAFQNCPRLKTVTFAAGKNYATIGAYSFASCPALESVYLPGNYVTVENNAFQWDSAITSFVWEKSSSTYANQSIYAYAFEGCSNLSILSLPTTLNNIEDGAFKRCTSLKNVVIPEGVTFIGDAAFYECKKLESVSLPSTLTRIDGFYVNNGAFQNCPRLKTVTFAAGKNYATIGAYSFASCPALESVCLPGNYVTVENNAFQWDSAITSFVWEKSSSTYANQSIYAYAFEGCSNLSILSLPTTLNNIEDGAFKSCTSLKNVVVPEGVTFIGDAAFYGCEKLESVSLPSTLTRIDGFNVNNGAFQNCPKLKTVIFAEGEDDASIGAYAFASCPALESVYLPGNYVAVENNAFQWDSSITSFIWEKSSTPYANQNVNAYAFEGCSNLKTLTLPTTLNTIGDGAFKSCTSLKNVVVPEGVTFIGDAAFYGCEKLESVSLPSTLTRIDGFHVNNGAFQNCPKLKTVIFAEGEDDATIGAYSFASCPALESVYLPGNYVTVENYAFQWDSSIASFVWEKSSSTYANQSIYAYAFEGCSNLSILSLPTTLKGIDDGVFKSCTSLKNVVVPEGITFIGDAAFYGCEKLESVSLPSTLTRIDGFYVNNGAFQNCPKLKTVVFAEGEDDLTIKSYTFANCPALTTVHIPLNTTHIEGNAFDGRGSNLVICSKSSSSYGKTYADANGIKFRVCSAHEEIKPDAIKYTVTYDANGGSVTPASSVVEKGNSVTLPTPTKYYTVKYNANGGTDAPASQKVYLTCAGWQTASGKTYDCGSEFTPTATTALTARWNSSAKFTVTSSVPTRSGYIFLGWAASASDKTAAFHAGDEVTLSGGDVTYYAVWEKGPSFTVSQTEIRLDEVKYVNGYATIKVENPKDMPLTLDATATNDSIVEISFVEIDASQNLYRVTFKAKKVGSCTVTFSLYNGISKLDEKTVDVVVASVPYEEISVYYKQSHKIKDFNGEDYESDNEKVATVDNSGKITAKATGTAMITGEDADGNVRQYQVNVTYAWWQILIRILLLGFLWY